MGRQKNNAKQEKMKSELSSLLINGFIFVLLLVGIIWTGMQANDMIKEIKFYKGYDVISGEITEMKEIYIDQGEEKRLVYIPVASCIYNGENIVFSPEKPIYDSKPFSNQVKILTNGEEFLIAQKDIVFWHYLPVQLDRGLYFMGASMFCFIPLAIVGLVFFGGKVGFTILGLSMIMMAYMGIYFNLYEHSFLGLFFIPFGLTGLLVLYTVYIQDPEKHERQMADAGNAHMVKPIELFSNKKNGNFVYILEDYKSDGDMKLLYSSRFENTLELHKNYYIDARRAGGLKHVVSYDGNEYIDISSLTVGDFKKTKGWAARYRGGNVKA